ncbi:MAG: nucleotidyl transferase AbiEii/AbiGii toxin family protein, partial [Myxococcales bacterium]
MPVPRPEYLAAMKAQAIKEAPSRTARDLADVAALLRLPGIDDPPLFRQTWPCGA